ncbi:nucleoside hydrolase [Paenibacillus sp. GXUN7292]|uniref:nucleoside hydrolase n=1 Tax=Paenibacillus sp. GXUN7292 TaxID=3422499 RepID=UPI003D7D8EBD
MKQLSGLTEEQRLKRLNPPQGKISMVLDTDTFNEIDDQFAIVYTLLAKERIDLKAIYAAPFHNSLSDGAKDGMEKSYEEIQHILHRMNVSDHNFVFKGSESFMLKENEPIDSAAARDLIAKAKEASPEAPLYVVAIGAITNVASAILLAPEIINHIVVVWLGGHALHWPQTKEFNLVQDVWSARTVLDCGAPLVLIPCAGVASHLITSLPEINEYVKDKGAIGQFLAERYESCANDHFAYSRVIWDISAIAWLLQPEAVPTDIVHSPVLTDQVTWSVDHSRHLIRVANFVNRDMVFKDLFGRLDAAYREGKL